MEERTKKMSKNAHKKAKTDEPDVTEGFDKVRQYILDCPVVDADHPAVKAALSGLDAECKRLVRDAKLKQKFMQDAVAVEKPTASTTAAAGDIPMTEEARPKATGEDESMTDDWHDIAVDNNSPSKEGGRAAANSDEEEDSTSFLGKMLAKEAIAAIAEFRVIVKSPVQALAVALHAAMRSEALGFACTGVPEETSSTSGFAPSIRALPKTQFLPQDWDKYSDKISIRYRKNSTGAVVLKVVQSSTATVDNKDAIVQVTLVPTTGQQEPVGESLVFSLDNHINLDSWAHAVQAEPHGKASPALHYKALSQLMTNFAKTFDLGHVHDATAAAVPMEHELPYVDTTIQNLPAVQPALHRPPGAEAEKHLWDDGTTPTIDRSFPGLHNRPGDFSGDLTPAGVVGPAIGTIDPSQAGSLMGPNHPIFRGGGGMSGVAPQSGFGMQPRFDPYGPPGGPTEPDNDDNDKQRPGNRRRPGGSGDPNPDHLRPPKNLSNNMFM